MRVINLDWISFTGKEAELVIADGENECLAFCQPFHLALGDKINDVLHAIDVEGLMIIREGEIPVNISRLPEQSYFSHYCIAKVFDIEKNIVSVGNIYIELDTSIPSWVNEGDLVEFSCGRLDIW